VALAACDPCAGVYRCSNESLVRASGRVIEFKSGRGVPGVHVEFRPAPGAASFPGGILVATTDADGYYTVSGGVNGTGNVVTTLRVVPPVPDAPYEIPAVTLGASSRRGEGTTLLPVFARPWVAFVGEVRRRAAGGDVAAGATVVFQRDSGGTVSEQPVIRSTDGGGRFYFESPVAGGAPVYGTFRVSGGPLPRTYIVPYVVRPLYFDTPPGPLDAFWQLGASLDAVARFVDDATGAPFRGTAVEFVRTGGAALVQDRVTFTTNDDGYQQLPLQLAVDEPGEVVGDLTVRPVGQPARTFRGARIRSIDTGDYRILDPFRFPRP